MKKPLPYSLIIALIAALFFLPFLGEVHLFDWDEINFAECAREMIVSGDYLKVTIGFDAFWEKPPLFFWLQAASMHLCGVGEYAARFPNAICGIFTLILLFRIGQKLYDTRFGLLWVAAYFGSILPHLYFKSGIIDPVFNLFIFLSLYALIQFHWKKDSYEKIALQFKPYTYLFIAGIFMGLAMLTKGQAAFVIMSLVLFIYWLFERFRWYINIGEFAFFTVISVLVTGLWFGVETAKNGTWFVETFITYQYRLFSTQDAGHGGFPGYHFVVLLVGCFPASIFAIRGFWKQEQEHQYQRDFKRWMQILFWVVLILFSIVQSKIVHYSSLCYFPLTYLAALTLYQIMAKKIEFTRSMRIGLGSLATIFGLACFAVPILGMNIEWLQNLLKQDVNTVAILGTPVNWSLWQTLPAFSILGSSFLGIYWLNKQQFKQGIISLFGGTAIFILLALVSYIGRIEQYSQSTPIEFYKTLVDKDCYVDTYGFSSYAPFFYAKKRRGGHKSQNNLGFILHHPDLDKDAYLVAKLSRADEIRKKKKLWKEIGGKNGFVFFYRQKPSD